MLDKLKQIFNLNNKTDNNQQSVEEKIEEAFNSLGEDIVKLEFGEDLIEFADMILERISEFRENLKTDTGFIFPPVHVLQAEVLQENELVFYVRGKEVEHEFIIPNEESVSKYIDEVLSRIFENYIDEIFTMEYLEKYINKVNSWLVWDISKQLGAYDIKVVLTNLIKEKKSISDINRVFEKIDECLSENKDCYYVWNPDAVSKRISKEI